MTPLIIGDHPSMKALLADAEALAHLNLPVLITGETGTGKDLVARYIHERSTSATGSFHVIDCGCLSEEMTRSELFGHTRGAFTGAHVDSPGLFGSVKEGTAFLDEVCEVSTSLQLQLLRVIETGEFRKVGGSSLQRLRARVLMATNRDIESDVAKGTLRRDFYYRISGLRLEVPPLRSRLSDIPLIANHLLNRLEHEMGRSHTIETDAMDRMLRYSWPGNVRELLNHLRIAAFRCRDGIIRSDDVGRLLGTESESSWTALTYRQAKTRIHKEGTRQYVEVQLAQTGRNVTRAAELSGVSRQYFQKLMTDVGVSRSGPTLPDALDRSD